MALMIHQQAQDRLQAIEALHASDSERRRTQLERLLVIYPDFSPAHDRLADLHERTGEPAAAAKSRMRAITGDPYNADYWVKLASTRYRALRQMREAVSALKQALQIDQAHPAALALLAELERSARPHPADRAPSNLAEAIR